MQIISEKFVPDTQKTIRPLTSELGGVAGGEKYIVAGILFKFAIDSKGLYGSDDLAAKEAGHQLKSNVALSQCQTVRVCPKAKTLGWGRPDVLCHRSCAHR